MSIQVGLPFFRAHFGRESTVYPPCPPSPSPAHRQHTLGCGGKILGSPTSRTSSFFPDITLCHVDGIQIEQRIGFDKWSTSPIPLSNLNNIGSTSLRILVQRTKPCRSDPQSSSPRFVDHRPLFSNRERSIDNNGTISHFFPSSIYAKERYLPYLPPQLQVYPDDFQNHGNDSTSFTVLHSIALTRWPRLLIVQLQPRRHRQPMISNYDVWACLISVLHNGRLDPTSDATARTKAAA